MDNNKKDYFLGLSVLVAGFTIAAAWVYTAKFEILTGPDVLNGRQFAELESKVIPEKGVVLPVVWGDLGRRLVESGVIDRKKFMELYSSRQDLNEELIKLLNGSDNGNLKITSENSGMILNLLWALGLGNKNEILEKGSMSDPRFGGPGVFASTGGWTLADGDVMNHYSVHEFVKLTPDQQKLVEEMSKNIYRPCCNNPTYFPDCNHGMAMLGLLELAASQGADEKEMYRVALTVNSYWFPETYIAIARFLEMKGLDWQKAEPKNLLGVNFSSVSGYQEILSELKPVNQGSGGSCGI